jgi:hypothetical protein
MLPSDHGKELLQTVNSQLHLPGNTVHDVVQPYGGQLSQGFSKRHAVDITDAAQPLPNTFAQGNGLGFNFCSRSSLLMTMINVPCKQHWTSLHRAIKLKMP